MQRQGCACGQDQLSTFWRLQTWRGIPSVPAEIATSLDSPHTTMCALPVDRRNSVFINADRSSRILTSRSVILGMTIRVAPIATKIVTRPGTVYAVTSPKLHEHGDTGFTASHTRRCIKLTIHWLPTQRAVRLPYPMVVMEMTTMYRQSK